jgi:hypothetical protein
MEFGRKGQTFRRDLLSASSSNFSYSHGNSVGRCSYEVSLAGC